VPEFPRARLRVEQVAAVNGAAEAAVRRPFRRHEHMFSLTARRVVVDNPCVEFEAWLVLRGGSYQEWASKHPSAAAKLESRAPGP
jgi:hypothetical protein